MKRIASIIAIHSLTAAALIGCATQPAARTSGADAGSSRHRLTAAQIEPLRVLTAFEAVERLRPDFLSRTRGSNAVGTVGPQGVVVYVDNVLEGGVDALRRIHARSVVEIRYMSATQAAIRYGGGHPAGVLLVVTGERRFRSR